MPQVGLPKYLSQRNFIASHMMPTYCLMTGLLAGCIKSTSQPVQALTLPCDEEKDHNKSHYNKTRIVFQGVKIII